MRQVDFCVASATSPPCFARGRRLQGVVCSESSLYSTLKHVENVFWSYLAEFAELRGAPPKQSCQEWYEVREITRDSAWGRLPDGNVFYGSIRTLNYTPRLLPL